MIYEKGTFVVVPNKNYLRGKPAEMQSVYLWLVDHSNDNGQCFPSRKKLSKEAGCGVATVDKYLSNLVEDGFVKITPRFNHDTNSRNSNMYTLLLIQGLSENDSTPPIKNDIVTIPILNSTHLTQVTVPVEIASTEVKETKPTLPEKLGRTYITRLLTVYKRLFVDKFGFEPTINVPLFGKTCKELCEAHSEVQLAAMMIIFFNWNGMNGGDARAQQRLVEATFPIVWFKNGINTYEAYARNVFNLDLDKPQELLQFLRENLPKSSSYPQQPTGV